jgi:hypothetical protein
LETRTEIRAAAFAVVPDRVAYLSGKPLQLALESCHCHKVDDSQSGGQRLKDT